MAAFQYNSAEISLAIDASTAGLGTHTVFGFADGSMVRVSRAEAMFGLKASGDGKVSTFNKRNNRNGTIAFTLDAASPSNQFLRTLALQDEQASTGVVAVQVKDNSGLEKASSAQMRLTGPPEQDFATESGTREWMFVGVDVDIAAEGSTQL